VPPVDAGRAVAHLRRCDSILAGIMRVVGPCRFRPDLRTSAFQVLAQAVISQQITGTAAASIERKLLSALGRRRLSPADVGGASEKTLRSAGLSRQKIGYLRDLAQKTQDGLPLRSLGRLPDETVIEILTSVKGIGRWTAEMYLMFRLGRPDVLPVHDYGIRQAVRAAYRLKKLPDPAWIRRKAEPWRPYRTIACWYLWRSLETR
jgi:3-methyladenine DNA glycosylase/8-oxoguanine DNA glycosylase